jgi:hypothetical protein
MASALASRRIVMSALIAWQSVSVTKGGMQCDIGTRVRSSPAVGLTVFF